MGCTRLRGDDRRHSDRVDALERLRGGRAVRGGWGRGSDAPPGAPTGAIARHVVRSSDMDRNPDRQGIGSAPAAAGADASSPAVDRSDRPVGLTTLLLAALALLVACGAPAASPTAPSGIVATPSGVRAAPP